MKQYTCGGVVALVLAVIVSACGSSGPGTGPTPLASGGSLASIADLPVSNNNANYSCPKDAPSPFTVNVDGPQWKDGAVVYKFTVAWRRTSPVVLTYVLETRRRERNQGPLAPAVFATLEGGMVHTLYRSEGIYHDRVRLNCGGSDWSVEVVRNAGASVNPPAVEPPPVDEEKD